MKREEETNIAAKNKYPYIKGLPQTLSHQAIFIEGAEWADKTMLDRACEWLKSRLNYVEDYIGDLTVCSFDYETVEEFITAFKQAMKGGAE